MEIAAILSMIAAAKEAIAFGIHQAQLLQQKGEITPEQMADVKARAEVSNSRWDAIVAEAKARIAAGQPNPGG